MARTAGRAVEATVMKVTPAQAKEWLENNHVNRRVRPKVVSAYRRDMEQGRWQFTGEAIKVSRTGALIDGQHRLMALADAEGIRNVDMLVVTGLPDEAQQVMDQGVARNIRDALVLEHGHVKNVTIVSSVTRWLVLAPEVGPEMTPSSMRDKVTAAEALEVFNQAPALITEAGAQAQAMRPYLLGSPTAIAYCWVQFSRVDHSATEDFFEGMKNMEWSLSFGTDDPRKAALRRLHLMHGDKGLKANIETGVMSVSVLTRAWNHYRKGESVDTLNVATKTGIILPVVPV